MTARNEAASPERSLLQPRELLKALAPYRKPSHARGFLELLITLVPFFGLWVIAYWSLSYSFWIALPLSIIAGGFLVRIFLIQHDCGHGSFFGIRMLNDWTGRILGVLTMTPYDVWRRSHAIHHATSGNLDARGIGDIDTLTVREYRSLSSFGKLKYRLYRSAPVMLLIGPAWQFVLRNRLPQMFNSNRKDYWISAMGTNLSITVFAGIFMYFLGWQSFLVVHIPVILVAATIGVWMFYVQHQFEDTFWEGEERWQMYEAALKGSSHYDLPTPLRWLTANIGIHHVHHLASKIPYYRLHDVLIDFPELAEIRRMTFLQSLSCINLRLWDEDSRKLVTFKQAKALGRINHSG